MSLENHDDYILAIVRWVIGGMVAIGGLAIAAIKSEKIAPILKSMFGIDVPEDVIEDAIEQVKGNIENIDDIDGIA